jgi:hypothetical protein
MFLVPEGVVMSLNFKRLGAVLALTGLTACAGRTVVPMADLADPPKSESYFVTTQAGEQYEFVTFRAEGDTLLGTIRIVKQRVVGQGESERVEERNQYREVAIPTSQVSRVEIQKSGPPRLLLAAAGAAALGGVYLLLNKSDDEPVDTGGGGRPPIDFP